jgi:Putative auto-transporter adhesin, head GIN domain
MTLRTLAMNSLAAILAASAVLLVPSALGADLQTESRPLSGFHRIEADGQLDITLVRGDKEGVTVEAPASLLSMVRTDVRGGTLMISVRPERGIWDWLSGRALAKPVRVTVNLKDLDSIESAGAVTVAADSLKTNELRLDFSGACELRIGDLRAQKVVLDGSGTIKAQIGGAATRQSIDLSGAGSYDAREFVTEDTMVEVSGAGKVRVHATKTLSVEISGAGLVEYAGDPKLRQSISGIGKIVRRDPS